MRYPVQLILTLAFIALHSQVSDGADGPIILGDPPTESPAHRSGLVSLPDGTVEAYYLRDSENGKEIACRRSLDEGRNWTAATTVFKLPGDRVEPFATGDWTILRPLRTNNGELHFFVLRVDKSGARAGADQLTNAYYVGSRDGGRRWHGPELVFEGTVGPPRCALELDSGRILYPFDHAIGDRDTHYPTGIGEVRCAYSDDGGDNWQISPSRLTTPVDPVYRAPNYGALEPIVATQQGDELWMLLRTSVGKLYQSCSKNNGESWTDAEPTALYSSNSPADFVRLEDGRLVLFWNNCQNAPTVDGSEPYTNRDVLHAAVSDDDGKTWRGFREIYRAPRRNESAPKTGTTWGTSYPDAVPLRDSKVLVMAGHGPDSAKMILVDTNWLLDSASQETFAKDLEKWSVYKSVGPIETSWRQRIAGARLTSHPERTDANVLHVRRPENEPADGAVWNFPKGERGRLSLKLHLNANFAGASIALADRFYDPTDIAGERQAQFDLRISNYRQLMSGLALDLERWYDVELAWDCDEEKCDVLVDGKQALTLEMRNPSVGGVNYLRLRSLAQASDDGFLVASVSADLKADSKRSLIQLVSNQVTTGAVESPRVVSSFEAEAGSQYPFRQNMYRALLLPDGRIMALSIARDSNRQQVMQARYSTDEGETWSEPEDLFEFPREAGGFGLFEALVDQQGEIQIASLCDGNSGIMFPKEPGSSPPTYDVLEIWHARSTANRTKWDAPKRIRQGRNSDLLSMTELKSGRLVLPICFATGRTWNERGPDFLDYTYVGGYSSGAMYSDDHGVTWHDSPDELSAETPSLSAYGAVEPVAIQLKDGRTWMLLRTQVGRFYESYSDDGARWSPAKPSKLIASDAPAGLLRLPDGGLLLFCNATLRYPYAQGARTVLHVAVSYDEGATWRGFRELVRDPLRDEPPLAHSDYGVGYTFPTMTKSGKVLFSNWVEQGSVRRFRRFDPKWLLETKQDCDFANGLEDWSVFGSRGVEIEKQSDGTKILVVRKADEKWPAGAVWNFPIGSKGKLSLRMKLRPGFGGALVGLTDHFSKPWDMEDQFHNVFNLPLTAAGEVAGQKVGIEQWFDLELIWNTEKRKCEVFVNDKHVGDLEDQHRSAGVNYFRIRSTTDQPDGGLVISRIEADVTESWPEK